MNANIWKKIAYIDHCETPNPYDTPDEYIFVVRTGPYRSIEEIQSRNGWWIEERYGIHYDNLSGFDYWCTKDEFFKSFEEQAN